jgi:CheY-like chemotaxis protein
MTNGWRHSGTHRPPNEEEGAPPVTLHGITILIVDDTDDIRRACMFFLTALGATVMEESSAAAGLRTLVRERPDVLLSDIKMPDHDGLWLIAQIRALPSHQGGNTPAAAITGENTPRDEQVSLSAGFQYHLPKPVDADRLAGVVARLAGSSGCGTATAVSRRHLPPSC